MFCAYLVRLVGGSLILVIGLLLAGLCLGILVLSLPVLGLLLAGFGVSALLLTLGLLRCVLGRVFGVGVILLLLGCLNVGTVGRLVLGLLSRRLLLSVLVLLVVLSVLLVVTAVAQILGQNNVEATNGRRNSCGCPAQKISDRPRSYMRIEVRGGIEEQCRTDRITCAAGSLPWNIAALGLAVAVTAGICPALDALAKRLGNADGRTSGAGDRRCAEGGGPDE